MTDLDLFKKQLSRWPDSFNHAVLTQYFGCGGRRTIPTWAIEYLESEGYHRYSGAWKKPDAELKINNMRKLY